jgi:hypothetical protein
MAKPKPNVKELARKLCICAVCFDDVKKLLLKCIIGTGNLATSNIKQHNDAYHAGVTPKMLYKSSDSQGNNKRTSSMLIGSATKSVKSGQSSMSRFVRNLPTSKVEACAAVKSSIYKCVNDLGFAASTVEQPVFRKRLTTVFENAPYLSPRDLMMSTRTLTNVCVDSYKEYVDIVQKLGQSIRAEYITLCGKLIVFATICHDV